MLLVDSVVLTPVLIRGTVAILQALVKQAALERKENEEWLRSEREAKVHSEKQ